MKKQEIKKAPWCKRDCKALKLVSMEYDSNIGYNPPPVGEFYKCEECGSVYLNNLDLADEFLPGDIKAELAEKAKQNSISKLQGKISKLQDEIEEINGR